MAETFDEKLALIEQGDKAVLETLMTGMQNGGPIYVMDFTLIAAGKRTLALSAGFRGHMKERNFTCAAALLRLQLDTALRLFAGTLHAAGPEAYFQAIFDGKPVDRMKDAHGNRLTDSYIAKRLSEQHGWVQRVYKELCDFVHLSNRHFFTSIAQLNDEDRTFHLSISAADPKRPDTDYFEVLDAYFSCMKLTLALLHMWQMTKAPTKAA